MRPAVAIAAVLVMGAHPWSASAAAPSEALALILNGRATGLVGAFSRCDGEPCAAVDELLALGLRPPVRPGAPGAPVKLSSLPGVRVRIDEARQLIFVEAADAAVRPTEIDGALRSALAPLSPSAFGLAVNYDVMASYARAQGAIAGLINLRQFGPFGLLESTAVVAVSARRNSVTRLNTTYTYAFPGRRLRLRLGDVATGALPWNRAVRLGGIQINSDFALRPDLVTYPSVTVRASTVVPATVSLIENGVSQYGQDIPPGPFSVSMLPVITGAGEATVSVQDALGRQVLITQPFYATRALLAPGLTSYSGEAGLIRDTFGSGVDRYREWGASGSARHGVNDWLTLEMHGEATRELGQIGVGATARIGTVGVVNLALSGSGQRGVAGEDALQGAAASIGFQRVTRRFSFNVDAALNSAGFRDLAATRGFRLPRSTLDASLGYRHERWGAIGVAYIARDDYPASDARDGGGAGARFRAANASYSIHPAGLGTFYVSGYRDFRDTGGYGVSVGFSRSFGSAAASLDASLNNGSRTISTSLSRSVLEPGDLGYRLRDDEGPAARRTAEIEYLGRTGRLTAGIEEASGQLFGRVGTRGALVFVDGGMFASDAINDSFALVRTGDVAHVPVAYENRPIGVTDARGRLLVPALLSYQNNRLSIDASGLPADVEVGQSFMTVRPRDGAGTIVDFQIRRVRAAVVRLRRGDGQPVPIGSVTQAGDGPVRPVGYDGEVYLSDLDASNRLTVTQPDGSVCTAEFTYVALAGDIPTIGPVRCQ